MAKLLSTNIDATASHSILKSSMDVPSSTIYLLERLSNKDAYSYFDENNDENQFLSKEQDVIYKSIIKQKSGDVKLKFNTKDWVFTQATAIASVNITPDTKWQITDDTLQYVNSNGNAWITQDLEKWYKSMVGAMNLKDHVDPSENGLIYGVIIDARPRKIKVPSGYIILVDILVATNRHVDEDWADAIENSKIRFMSVGFVCDFCFCSKCGHLYALDGTGVCEHCTFERNMLYYDTFGRKSKVAEIPTTRKGVGRAYFSEVSYLSVDPAFTGAVKSYNYDLPKNSDVIVTMPVSALKRPALKEFLGQYEILKR